MKKYLVTFNEEDVEEFEEHDIPEIIREQFNGIKTRGEQQDVLQEVESLEVGEKYTYFNAYIEINALEIRRIK